MSELLLPLTKASELRTDDEIKGLMISGNGDLPHILDCAKKTIGNEFYVRVAWVKSEEGGYDYVAQVGESAFGSDSDQPFTDLVTALDSGQDSRIMALQLFWGSSPKIPEGQIICLGIGEGEKLNALFNPTPEELSCFLGANGYVISSPDQALAVPQGVEV